MVFEGQRGHLCYMFCYFYVFTEMPGASKQMLEMRRGKSYLSRYTDHVVQEPGCTPPSNSLLPSGRAASQQRPARGSAFRDVC